MSIFNPSIKQILIVCAAVLCSTAQLQAQAQTSTYPTKPIKFIVPFPAGSATDNLGRVVAQAMSEALGQTITVENKAGSNGILGAEFVKNQTADPYTLLVTTSTTQAANVSLYKKLNYDPVKDFTPIGKIGVTGFVLMVKPDFPAKDVKEFAAWGKANPGKLAFGWGSSGSLVSAAQFNQTANIDAVSVPYKGIPPAMVDLMGGQVQYVFVDVGNAATQATGGKLRALGITTAKRAGLMPTVPPIGDTFKGYDISAWFGLMAPAGIPADVTKKLSDTLAAVLAKPDVKTKVATTGIDLDVQNSAELAKTIDAEIKKWAGWVKAANITAE
jgi:tripartite-type tricarboxylate transporter receptor subunit TctC